MSNSLNRVVKLTLILYLNCSILTSVIIQKERNLDDVVTRCVNTIINSHFDGNDIILSVNNDLDIDFPIMKHQSGQSVDLPNIGKFTGYVLSGWEENMENIFEYLNKSLSFNPAAKFVIIVTKIEEELLLKLSSYYISRTVFIVKEDICRLYKWEPYKYENAHEVNVDTYLLGDCRNVSLLHNGFIFDSPLPKKWRNTTMKVMYQKDEPYVIIKGQSFEGLDIDVLRIASERLLFDIEYTKIDYPYMSVRKLLQRKIDLVLGGIPIDDLKEYSYFDIVCTNFYNDLIWVAPSDKIIPKWKALISNFKVWIWCCIISSFIIMGLVVYLTLEGKTNKNISECFLTCFGSFVEIPVTIHCRRLIFRFTIAIWFLTSFVLTNSFKSRLLFSLMNDEYDTSLKTVAYALHLDMEICIDKVLFSQFKPLFEELHYINNRFTILDDESCFDRIVDSKDIIIPMLENFAIYNILNSADKFVGDDSELLVKFFQEPLISMPTRWVFAKGFPLAVTIETLLYTSYESGFEDKLWKIYMEKILPLYYNAIQKTLQSNEITFSQIAPAFFILGIGYLIATLVLSLEILRTQ